MECVGGFVRATGGTGSVPPVLVALCLILRLDRELLGVDGTVWRKDSSVDPISLLAEYTVLPLTSWKWKGGRSCGKLKMNKEKRKLDGMESSKSKSDAHFMHG